MSGVFCLLMADGCTHKVVFVGARTVGHQGMENIADDSYSKRQNPLIEEGVFMSLHTTMKIGGQARYFVEVKSVAELQMAIDFARKNDLEVFMLGGGSNTVFDDRGHDGIVIKNCIKGIEIIEENECVVKIKAFAGENFDGLVEYCVSKGFCGLENLSAIPGTLGGAIVQNVGAYGVEIKSVVESVEVFDSHNNTLKTLTSDDLKFDYRYSIFKEESSKKFFIISATLTLLKKAGVNISYKDLSNFFASNNKSDIKAGDVRKALLQIRSNKFPNLLLCGTAGSFFKNCIISKEQFMKLQSSYADMPFFELADGQIKIPTAWILDKVCGLRGHKDGDLGLYEKQSLVIVNHKSATSRELKEFIFKIKKKVFDATGITLEEEVIVL